MWWEQPGRSPLARRTWRARIDRSARYTLAATTRWGISFARSVDGALRCELDGPSPEVFEPWATVTGLSARSLTDPRQG